MDRSNPANHIRTSIKSTPTLSAWKILLISQRTLGTSCPHSPWRGTASVATSAQQPHNKDPLPTASSSLAMYSKGSSSAIKAAAQHFSEEISRGRRGSLCLTFGTAEWRCSLNSSAVPMCQHRQLFSSRSLCDAPLKRGGGAAHTGVVTSAMKRATGSGLLNECCQSRSPGRRFLKPEHWFPPPATLQ